MTRYYTEDHEWIDVDGDSATVGITDYAQSQLGDIVFAEVPAPGAELKKGGDAAVVESVKAASDVYAPVSGTVTEGNDALEGDPALVNTDPEGEGWFFKLTLSDTSELASLMDADAYKAFVEALSEAAEFAQNDKAAAADTYIRVTKSKVDRDELLKIIDTPEYEFSVTPKNTYPLAEFLYRVGAIKNKPDSWKDYFFQDAKPLQGS